MQLHASTMVFKVDFYNQHNTQHCRNGGTYNYGRVSMCIYALRVQKAAEKDNQSMSINIQHNPLAMSYTHSKEVQVCYG